LRKRKQLQNTIRDISEGGLTSQLGQSQDMCMME